MIYLGIYRRLRVSSWRPPPMSSAQPPRPEPHILSEWELWACAEELIRQHGFEAPIFAAMHADELMEKADLDGAANWRLIVKRINELLARPAGAAN